MSSRKTTSFSIKLHTAEYVHVQIPTERRERKKTTSFSMPPSVKHRLDAYAKRQHMSASDLVTLLCVNFLESAMPERRLSETSSGTKEPGESQRSP